MRYFFHIFDGSELHPDDVGNNLPSLSVQNVWPKSLLMN